MTVSTVGEKHYQLYHPQEKPTVHPLTHYRCWPQSLTFFFFHTANMLWGFLVQITVLWNAHISAKKARPHNGFIKEADRQMGKDEPQKLHDNTWSTADRHLVAINMLVFTYPSFTDSYFCMNYSNSAFASFCAIMFMQYMHSHIGLILLGARRCALNLYSLMKWRWISKYATSPVIPFGKPL